MRNYPHLTFRRQWSLDEKTLTMIGQCEAYVETIRNTPILPLHYESLMNVALLKGAQATTAIEGNTLSDEEISKVMHGQELPPSKEYQQIEVKNVIEALNILLQEVVENNFDELITKDLLKRFHVMIGKDLGEHFEAIPGKLRQNQVIVGRYRCPDYLDVEELLDNLIEWLKDDFKYSRIKQSFSEIIIQAIITHVYIEWIHPFSDGNGRTGRLAEFYILLRGGNPDITSHILSNHYNQTRPEYYRQLENASITGDLTNFLKYSITGLRDGLKQTLGVMQESQFEITWQKLVYDKFNFEKHNMKTEKLKRLREVALIAYTRQFSFDEVSILSPTLAKLFYGLSKRTILRDLDQLLTMELLVKQQGNYSANMALIKGMLAKSK